MRRFRKFRDDRFALTTLQNPNLEVRTYAELCQAAQQERENQQAAAQAALSAAQADLPAVAGQPILISSRPVLENDAND